MRLIKKYRNRRLYDTEKSQYITMETLQAYVLKGIEFKVEDSVTKEDLTNVTLLQILVETGGNAQFFSTAVLRQLITFANHPMNKAIQAMLETIFSTLDRQVQQSQFISEYQSMGKEWLTQMEAATKQWENFFKK